MSLYVLSFVHLVVHLNGKSLSDLHMCYNCDVQKGAATIATIATNTYTHQFVAWIIHIVQSALVHFARLLYHTYPCNYIGNVFVVLHDIKINNLLQVSLLQSNKFMEYGINIAFIHLYRMPTHISIKPFGMMTTTAAAATEQKKFVCEWIWCMSTFK